MTTRSLTQSPGSPLHLARSAGARVSRAFVVLGIAALVYAFLAGLRTVTDYDLGWQMATARWIVHHHQLPSTDVLSYTAAGGPWIYPVGSGLIFYATYLLGDYALLSCLGAAACVLTVALLLRRGSTASAALAILAVPMIAARTTPRSEMFSTVLFAAFLSLLWQHHETGHARLWLLPPLMAAWVNLHLGMAAGLGLLVGYVLLELLEMFWPERRSKAINHLRRAWPWLIATFAATVMNPWGWNIYSTVISIMQPVGARAPQIAEYAPVRLNWTTISSVVPSNPDSYVITLLLAVAAISVPVALLRRQLGAALLIGGAAFFGVRHLRFVALFSAVVVVVAGAVLTPALAALRERIADARIRSMLFGAAVCLMLLLVCAWSVNLVTDRIYLGRSDQASFGVGLGWWFPRDAASFIERQGIPGQIFNSQIEGGYIAWRLGPKYGDYVDGRGSPFGLERLRRSELLMRTPPNSPEWQREAERYDINSIIVPLGRYDGLALFPVLHDFCASQSWRPVYLDEVSAVFVRRRPETEDLIRRLQINCATAPLPAVAPPSRGAKAFNQWANAAAVLRALGRNRESFAATTQALAIFPDSAFANFLKGNLLEVAGDLRGAEEQYRLAARLDPRVAVIWFTLARLYQREGRLAPAIDAWKYAADVADQPWTMLLSLGQAYLAANRPEQALQAFDRCANTLPLLPSMLVDNSFLSNLAYSRAVAWSTLGDRKRAIEFQQEAVQLSPETPEFWLYLARLYETDGRVQEAQQARERAGRESANAIR